MENLVSESHVLFLSTFWPQLVPGAFWQQTTYTDKTMFCIILHNSYMYKAG